MPEPGGGVLSREQISQLLDSTPPLLDGLIDRAAQLQPNGVDITLESIARFNGAGTIAVDNADRVLPETEDFRYGEDERFHLDPGCYLVRFNEVVNLPADVMAYTRPRSSLLRVGVSLHNAVWDAGYSGRGVGLLVVYNPHGFAVEHNARIGQLVFHRLAVATSTGYQGAYQGEGRKTGDKTP